MVYDLSGLHVVDLTLCGCHNSEGHIVESWAQLFRMGWYPATHDRPRSAFTFRVLDFFQELTFQGKTNTFDFYKALERISDICELSPRKVSAI